MNSIHWGRFVDKQHNPRRGKNSPSRNKSIENQGQHEDPELRLPTATDTTIAAVGRSVTQQHRICSGLIGLCLALRDQLCELLPMICCVLICCEVRQSMRSPSTAGGLDTSSKRPMPEPSDAQQLPNNGTQRPRICGLGEGPGIAAGEEPGEG